MRTTSHQAHDRAEALFKKQERLRDGQNAMAEYRAELRAIQEKTVRLRALRLAHDRGGSLKPLQPTGRDHRKRHD